MIHYGKQSINQEDIEAVIDVLKSDFLTQGPKVIEFEENLKNYCGAKYSKVVSNATSALHLAYLAIGLKKDDIVWTSANTFVSTANAALYCGAKVKFIDINPKTYNISIDAFREKLVVAKKANQLPYLVVPVHFAGQSCEMSEIWDLSKEFGFKVIEDASHALGGVYKKEKVGSCNYSDMAVFSFHPVKMITTGEGGAIVTNDKLLDEKISLFRTHGITKEADKFINKSHGNWYYEQQVLGFNYRMTDIQAALGISQLKRLESFVGRRKEIAEYYLANLKACALPYQHPDCASSWHLFVVKAKNRKEVYKQLLDQGVQTQVHYIPVNSQPFHRSGILENTQQFYEECLSLPIYMDLTNEECMKVIESINNVE